jgi:hypothetical protein
MFKTRLSEKAIFSAASAPVGTFGLITIVITNLLNGNTVTIVLQDFLKNFAIQVCALIASPALGCLVTP